MHDYEKLDVWKRAMGLVTAVYEHTQHMPIAERYGLVAQLRRAAVSIPTNIAEGAGRRTATDFSRFLSISAGSCSELSTLLDIADTLGYLNDAPAVALMGEASQIRRMAHALADAHGRRI